MYFSTYKKTTFSLLLLFFSTVLYAQKATPYNLAALLHENKIQTMPGRQPVLLADGTQKNAITTNGLAWIPGIQFSEGSIDVDLRGKDIFLHSFLGIAFHAKDSSQYEVIYFRPFNFRHADTLRRKWSVQYMVIPDYDYTKLRAEHPLVYENAVKPVPKADEWFHAKIIVKNNSVSVFVNQSTEPSLVVNKIGSLTTGMIGLWDSGITGDFANLEIGQ
ncbi:MAG: hypothetical protein QM726_15310 [Chitinophagaceae bacterium]